MQQVIVQLFNGLGNQLFQYAAGRWVASTLGASLRLIHHRDEEAQKQRPLLLQEFDIEVPVERMSALDRLVVSEKPRFNAPARMVRTAKGIQVFRQDPKKIARPFDFALQSPARAIYMTGYFQEYLLVQGVQDLLRRELTLRHGLHSVSQHYANSIRATRTPISIHLRRGDYLSAFGPSGVLPISYYDRAIEHMQDQFRHASFFVFSDDIAFARYWAAAYPGMTVVDCNDPALAHECLLLMSLCQHHILANSTFSWWGMWLNARRNKHVVAPDNWLGTDTGDSPIACPDWQLLPADQPTRRRAADRGFALRA